MMLVRAFFSSNTAMGCAFGGFGVAVLSLQERFGASRAMASMGLALTVLTLSLSSPLVATMIIRLGLRKTMISGMLLSASGYIALAFAPSMLIALTSCALLIGPGTAMFGTFPSSILAGGWSPQARGRAVGMANIPLLLILIPILGVTIIQRFGLPAFFLTLAGLHLLLLPLMLGIADPPLANQIAHSGGSEIKIDRHPNRALLFRPLFWAMVIGDGIFNAVSVAGLSHIVPVAVESGIPVQGSGLLLSLMGFGSIPGSILSGYLCDRFGPTRALTVAGLGFAVSWSLIGTGWLPGMTAATLLMGMCGSSILPPVNVLATRAFGVVALPRALSLIAVFALPFTFIMPPAAGLMRDLFGDYDFVIIFLIVAALIGATTFFLIERTLQSSPKVPA
ncbi:MFS family permease [Sphingobium vermicomposti]|uniref:MFS family permease n=2 Tax=Sphingobium vermicomposti TaxID=529005 RepID=A0A846M6H6_9SPHN|nr:MFS family permease [Sphingobium vermicomposti]